MTIALKSVPRKAQNLTSIWSVAFITFDGINRRSPCLFFASKSKFNTRRDDECCMSMSRLRSKTSFWVSPVHKSIHIRDSAVNLWKEFVKFGKNGMQMRDKQSAHDNVDQI